MGPEHVLYHQLHPHRNRFQLTRPNAEYQYQSRSRSRVIPSPSISPGIDTLVSVYMIPQLAIEWVRDTFLNNAETFTYTK